VAYAQSARILPRGVDLHPFKKQSKNCHQKKFGNAQKQFKTPKYD
jgi:hypothetical protein